MIYLLTAFDKGNISPFCVCSMLFFSTNTAVQPSCMQWHYSMTKSCLYQQRKWGRHTGVMIRSLHRFLRKTTRISLRQDDFNLKREAEAGRVRPSCASLPSQHIPGQALFLDTSSPHSASHRGQVDKSPFESSRGATMAFTPHNKITHIYRWNGSVCLTTEKELWNSFWNLIWENNPNVPLSTWGLNVQWKVSVWVSQEVSDRGERRAN